MARQRLRKEQPGQYDKSRKAYGNSLISGSNNDRDYWWEGYVTTEQGIVLVLSIRYGFRGKQQTQLKTVANGKLVTRYMDVMYWPRTLVTLAKRFAAEVAARGAA